MPRKRKGLTSARKKVFRSGIHLWYTKHRRDLPWRRTNDPYAILVSEFMLQQTQVDRVVPAFTAFLKRWPTVRSLAHANRSSVVRQWAGLGYNSRAVRLHEAAKLMVERHQGKVPPSVEALEALPGIGPYTARAIASFAFHQRVTTVDVNHARVLSRYIHGVVRPKEDVVEHTAAVMLPRNTSVWNAALMDFGALICRSTPRCDDCPLRTTCAAYPAVLNHRTERKKKESFIGSNRFFRGRIVHYLGTHRLVKDTELLAHVRSHAPLPVRRFRLLLTALERDGLIVRMDHRVRLR